MADPILIVGLAINAGLTLASLLATVVRRVKFQSSCFRRCGCTSAPVEDSGGSSGPPASAAPAAAPASTPVHIVHDPPTVIINTHSYRTSSESGSAEEEDDNYQAEL